MIGVILIVILLLAFPIILLFGPSYLTIAGDVPIIPILVAVAIGFFAFLIVATLYMNKKHPEYMMIEVKGKKPDSCENCIYFKNGHCLSDGEPTDFHYICDDWKSKNHFEGEEE